MKLRRKNLITIIGMLFLVSVMTLAFSACTSDNNNNENSGNRQTPIYQGMTISDMTSAATAESYSAMTFAAGGQSGNSGNHYGWYKDKEQENIDQDKPFGEESDKIEEVIESSLKVTGSSSNIYYAAQNQDIYITIHIRNPDSFEIISFTLNGEKYSSYMFQDGSDMESIILKKNVGNDSGIVEYTIDAIKYIDGTEIKDVIIYGDQTVRAGVYTDNQVAVSVNETIGFNDIGLAINISDNDKLIEYSNGTLKAVLYNGEELIAERTLKVGETEVEFDGLVTGGLYQYAIVGYYNNLIDGLGIHILYKNAFYTEDIVYFDNITVTQDSIAFSFRWHNDSVDNEISEIALLYKGTETKLDIKTDSVNDLLSDNDYTLVARYINDGKTEEIKLDFHTGAKAMPVFELELQSTQNELSFDITETDVDNVGDITQIELLHGSDTTTVAQSTAQRSFENLSSYNQYTLKITYTYDLNDGSGSHTQTIEKSIYTKPQPMTVSSVTALDNLNIILGETIPLRITLNNPDNIAATSAIINGQATPLISTGGSSNYLANFVPAKGGKDYIYIDGLYYSFEGETFYQSAVYTSNVELSVLGNVSLSSVEFESDRDYYTKNEDLRLLLTFLNAEDYELKYISEVANSNNGYPLTKITDNTYSVSIPLSNQDYGMHNISLVALAYGLDENTSIGTISNCTVTYYVGNSSTAIDIIDVDDLKAMQNYYVYRLANDIDLSGIDWQPLNFYGYFDGAGHTISNMTIVRTDSNLSAATNSFGLFGTHSGVIKNLVMTNASIDITSSGSLSILSAGILLGSCIGDQSFYENCTIEGNVTVICRQNEWINVGGIVGYADALISDSLFKGSVLFSAPTIDENAIAFISGYKARAKNCVAIGSITLIENNVAMNSTTLCGNVDNCFYLPEGTKVTEVTYTFQTNGGSAVAPKTGYFITSAPQTLKNGYRFEGWYLDEALTQPVSYPLFSDKDIMLYAKWFDMSAYIASLKSLPESKGLKIEGGIITGIGTCTDDILVLDHPIASQALNDLHFEYTYDFETGENVYRSGVRIVVIKSGVTSIGYGAFATCEFSEIYFLSDTAPQIGEDVFADTWDSSAFRIYVPSALIAVYTNVSDGYWQNSIVSANKLVGF